MILREEMRRELYLFLLAHGKASMVETICRLGLGATITELGRLRSSWAGDARALDNVVHGRLVHPASTWQRRTARVARLVIDREADLSPEIVTNARLVLDLIELCGSGTGRGTRAEPSLL